MPIRIPGDIKRFQRAAKVLAACTTLAIGGPVAAAQAAASGSAPSSTTHFSGIPEVGALFSSDDYTGAAATHFCTATVIDSPSRDLVLTAAHCVYDASTGTYTNGGAITFAPGYDNGLDEHLGGAWTVTAIDVPDGYKTDGDPEDDYAILQIAPQHGLDIEQVTGGLRLATTKLPEKVSVIGYNDLAYDPAGNEPIICRTTAHEETDDGAAWSRFDCPNYQDGTSGGPWIAHGGTVVGVIGGYEQGGDSPNWSYSTIFTQATLAFYRSVAADA